MQKRGLVEREGCPSDRRGAFVVLTGTGRAAVETAARAHVETVRQRLFDGLTREQVRTLAEISDQVLHRLQEDPATARGA